MQRRRFLIRVTQAPSTIGAVPDLARARSPDTPKLHLQDCRITGSHYHDCHAALPHLRAGAAVRLKPQPDNLHSPRTVDVFWRRRKLGYLSRLDNTAALSRLARGHALSASIVGTDDPEEEWETVRLRVWIRSLEEREPKEQA